MHTTPVTRRRFGAAALATAAAALAGCLDEDALDTGGKPVHLVVVLENGNGDPVSDGVLVTISHDEANFTANYQNQIEDGRLVARNLADPGDYTITVESQEGAFDPVERGVSLGEAEDEAAAEADAAEITVELEGALGDADREGGDD